MVYSNGKGMQTHKDCESRSQSQFRKKVASFSSSSSSCSDSDPIKSAYQIIPVYQGTSGVG